MESVRPTPVNELRGYTKENKIRIRICRIWKSAIPGTVQKYTNLHCILVDEMVRNNSLEILPPSAIQGNEAQILQNAKKVTIDELAFLDPDLHKVNLILEDETNELNALIIGKFGEKFFGMPCKDLVLNQRLVEQQQLPDEFLRLIGQKKKFHLRFSNRRNAFNSNDVLIHNVTEDTAMQPATPQPLSRENTMSSTTVSSSTSMVEPTEQSFKRKRESIRRALFTSGEQSGVDQISDTDPREFDEVPIKLLKKKASPTAGKADGWFLEREQYTNRSWPPPLKNDYACGLVGSGTLIQGGTIRFIAFFRVNKIVKEIDRSEQQILEGDLARNDEKNEGTIVKYFDTAPGPVQRNQ
ncbi:unnamed protein product [Malus baccata var. baccata]